MISPSTYNDGKCPLVTNSLENKEKLTPTSSSSWCVHVIYLSVLLDWQLVVIVFVLKSLDINVRSILKFSFLAVVAYGIFSRFCIFFLGYLPFSKN